MPRTASPHPRRTFDSPHQEAFLTLWRAYDRLAALEDQVFSRFELTAQQYNVLRLLRGAHPGAVPTLSLVARLVSRAPDVTRMLDRLDQRELIVRTRTAEDRRMVLVGITQAGLRLLGDIAAPLRQCHERQLGHLSASELAHLVNLLRNASAPHEPPDSHWK